MQPLQTLPIDFGAILLSQANLSVCKDVQWTCKLYRYKQHAILHLVYIVGLDLITSNVIFTWAEHPRQYRQLSLVIFYSTLKCWYKKKNIKKHRASAISLLYVSSVNSEAGAAFRNL